MEKCTEFTITCLISDKYRSILTEAISEHSTFTTKDTYFLRSVTHLAFPFKLGQLVWFGMIGEWNGNGVGRKLSALTAKPCPCLKCCCGGWQCFVVLGFFLSLQLPRPGFICLSDVCRLLCLPPCFHCCCCFLQGCILLFLFLFTHFISCSFCHNCHGATALSLSPLENGYFWSLLICVCFGSL